MSPYDKVQLLKKQILEGPLPITIGPSYCLTRKEQRRLMAWLKTKKGLRVDVKTNERAITIGQDGTL